MLSLTLVLALLAESIMVGALLMSLAARLVGSQRAGVRRALATAAMLFAVGVVFVVISRLVPDLTFGPMMAIGLMMFVVQVTIAIVIMRWMFRITLGRSFAPLAAWVLSGFLQAALYLVLVRPHMTEGFVISSPGMSPTIEPRDRFFVNKLLTPRRFDIVGYWSNATEPVIFCHRLIGLPGERLRLENGDVYVNDALLDVPSVIAGHVHSWTGPSHSGRHRYTDGQTIILAEDEYFLIGDNTQGSADSRWYGPSPRESLIGVVDLAYWPPRKARIVR